MTVEINGSRTIESPFAAHWVRSTIATILRCRKQKLGTMRQDVVARRSNISPSTVSNWENPSGERAVGRESLKRIVTMGLRFPYEEADTLMWFAQGLWPHDQGPLTQGEVIDCIKLQYDPEVEFRIREPNEYKRIFLSMLEQAD